MSEGVIVLTMPLVGLTRMLGTFLQAAPATPTPSPLVGLAPFFIVIMIFYFMMWKPARKKQQETQEMLSQLKSGDRVVLTCGIYGTVARVEDDLVQVRLGDKVKVDVMKSAIGGRMTEEKS